MTKNTNKPQKKSVPINLQSKGPVHIRKNESTGKLVLRRSIMDIIDPVGAEERSRAKIRQADAEHKRSIQRREDLTEIGEVIISPGIKNRWQDKIRQAIKYFEGQKVDSDLYNYFGIRNVDPLRNINVIYLLLAIAHDDFLQVNFIITDELKKLNPGLFCWSNYVYYLREGRLHLFWEHVKQDLKPIENRTQNEPGDKSNFPRYVKDAIAFYDYALEKNPALSHRTDHDIYDWLKTADFPEGLDKSELKDERTMIRYWGEYRKSTGTQKNKPRAHRQFKYTEEKIENISEITSKFSNKPE